MMFVAHLLLAIAVAITGFAALWWMRRRRRSAPSATEVIYLGYADRDNVGSMRATMLDRVRRGELDGC